MRKERKELKILKILKGKPMCLALTLVVMTSYAKTADAKAADVISSDFVQEFIDYSNYTSNTTTSTISSDFTQEFIDYSNYTSSTTTNNNEELTTDEVTTAVDEVVELTNEEKLAIILERENLTSSQFAEILATVIGEAEANSYDDAYAVINTFYNRKISKTWIEEVLRVTGVDNGDNLYAQITLENQSSVYTSGSYKLYLGITDVPAYQAVIDFLYTLESKHNYLNFYASYGTINNSVQFSENGNWYYNAMPEEDRVEEDVVTLVRTNR